MLRILGILLLMISGVQACLNEGSFEEQLKAIASLIKPSEISPDVSLITHQF